MAPYIYSKKRINNLQLKIALFSHKFEFYKLLVRFRKIRSKIWEDFEIMRSFLNKEYKKESSKLNCNK